MRLFGRTFEYKWVVAAVFVSGLFLDIIDTTIVNVALPSLATDFRTDSVEWVVLGYTLSLAVWIPASGWFGDRYGTKRVMMTAMGLFVAGSVLCGTAQSIGQLITFRVLQGVGGGMMTPVGIAMLFRSFPPAERARAATVTMVPTMIAPALGPVLGGYLIGSFGWRWIFYINIPIGVATLVFGLKYLRESREPTAGRFDAAGFLTSGAALALIVFALSEGPRSGWLSMPVVAAGLVGLVSAVAMVIIETRIDQPMLALRLFRDRMFLASNLVGIFSMGSFIGLMFLVPLYLQTVRGFTPLQAGASTFTQAIGIFLSTQVSGRLYTRIGPRRLIFGGLLAASVANALFVTVNASSAVWTVRGLFLVRGLCMGMAFVPMQAATYATIAPSDNGRASSIFSTMRQVSISLAIAALATILASYTIVGRAATDVARATRGFHIGYLVTAVLALAGALMALRIRDADALSTMKARSEPTP